VTDVGTYRDLAEAAWSWTLDQVREDAGPWLPESVDEGRPQTAATWERDWLYLGIAGTSLALAEVAQHRPFTEREQRLADDVVARLGRQSRTGDDASLYGGLAGIVTALRHLAPGAERDALRRIGELRTPAGWVSQEPGPYRDMVLTDIIGGAAGIVLAALWSGDAVNVVSAGCDALLADADETAAGLDWGMVPHAPSRGPNFSHGTAGIASALAVVGTALGRADLVAAAARGAEHLLSVGRLDEHGFVVPHTIPPSGREVEPVTYTWCHGPAGTSQLFAALSRAGVAEVGGHSTVWLRQRCFDAILDAGVPQRLRPGFWDNDGRCCGTAGVGDVLLDAYQDTTDLERAGWLLGAARTMADALVERAIRDDAGARWRFVEHRIAEPLLPPGTSWMQGSAGIAAFLFRIARVLEQGPTTPVLDRPDQWWTVPRGLTISAAPAN
jgi:lantibiotic modifying enzyme